MKKSTIVTIILIAAAVVLGVIFISWYLRKATPLYIQGTVECTTYKASSKVPGRIEEMKVEEGQHVTKGELLYTLSTPELNAKLQQAEAVKSAASAMDQKALTGARIQQKEAALNLWEKAQAGLLLAQKTFDRVNNLYEQGVVPAQKLDEARANLQAMQATERAAKAQCELVFDGASKEEKEAAAAQVRQAEGAVSDGVHPDGGVLPDGGMVQNELPRHESDIMGGGLMSLGGQPGAVEEGSVRHPQLLGPLVHLGHEGGLAAR